MGECADGGEVSAAVEALTPGRYGWSPRAAGRPPSATAPRDAGLDTLTSRELEVLTLIGQGKTNGEIATGLFVSEGTVKTHINHLFTKLPPRDRAAAVVFANDHGLVRRH